MSCLESTRGLLRFDPCSKNVPAPLGPPGDGEQGHGGSSHPPGPGSGRAFVIDPKQLLSVFTSGISYNSHHNVSPELTWSDPKARTRSKNLSVPVPRLRQQNPRWAKAQGAAQDSAGGRGWDESSTIIPFLPFLTVLKLTALLARCSRPHPGVFGEEEALVALLFLQGKLRTCGTGTLGTAQPKGLWKWFHLPAWTRKETLVVN